MFTLSRRTYIKVYLKSRRIYISRFTLRAGESMSRLSFSKLSSALTVETANLGLGSDLVFLGKKKEKSNKKIYLLGLRPLGVVFTISAS